MAVSATLKKLRAANKGMKIYDISDQAFEKYGRVWIGFKPTQALKFAKEKAVISDDIVYEPSVAGLEKDKSFVREVSDRVFGGMPVQVGWCYGRNSMLDGLEYHKGIEVVVAVTDMVVILGDQRDIAINGKGKKREPSYSSAKAEVFYIPKGKVVEFHCWCLHFAPIHVRTKAGFASLVVLPEKTNTDIKLPKKTKGEEVMFFARNKWLLVHKSAKPLVEAGACVGITGRNLKVDSIS